MTDLKTLLDDLAVVSGIPPLPRSEYIGFFAKRLTNSDQLATPRPGRGVHIEITNPDGAMLVFPVVTSSAYINNPSPKEKRRYTARLPLKLSRANLTHLTDARLAKPLVGMFLTPADLQARSDQLAASSADWHEAHTDARFNQRGSGQLQTELGGTSDGSWFQYLRKLLGAGDYLVMLQRRSGEYDVLGVLQQDAGGKDLSGYQPAEATEKLAIETSTILNPVSSAQQLEIEDSDLEVISQLLDHRKNVILSGPPGTGKTRDAFRLADLWTQANGADSVLRVTFHPSYAYEDFILGFRPEERHAGTFKLAQGTLLEAAGRAWRMLGQGRRMLLVIDEINRADVARVFGEAITFLEPDKRDISFTLSQDPRLDYKFPQNLYILGTMNAADRSVSLIDAAMRRRFSFVSYTPRSSVFSTAGWAESVKGIDIPALLDTLNKRLLTRRSDPERLLGHALLRIDTSGPVDPGEQLRRVMLYDILPLIQEFCYFDHAEVAGVIGELVDEQGVVKATDREAVLAALAQIAPAPAAASASEGGTAETPAEHEAPTAENE